MQTDVMANQILDVFSTQEINLIKDVFWEKLIDAPNAGKFRAYTNGFTTSDPIYLFFKKIVLPKLEHAIEKKLKLTHGVLLKERFPWSIHSDYVKSDNNPDLGILIPLNSDTLNTHTVVFNQLCLNTFAEFIETNSKVENNAGNLIDNLMSHESIDRLEYVSLLNAYRWVPGSVIFWDRKLLHSSLILLHFNF
jgi:hypothetical protein